MAETTLRIENVSKAFGKNVVLKDVNLKINNGEFIVLLGPSGCGKTTLLNAISGLGLPDKGNIILKDKDITNLPVNKRDMGIVFQSYALFPHMNVRDNIAFGLRMRKLPKDEIAKKVKEGLSKVHLDGYEDRKIDQMSGGQRQRVALARALVLNPSLLLMDEPLSNLDAKLRATVRVEIAEIQRSLKLTTIMVTHDQVEAMTMAHRIVLLQDGIIQQDGKPVDIYEKPANMFVAGFVGSPSINFVEIKKDKSNVEFNEMDIKMDGLLNEILAMDKEKAAQLPSGEFILGIRPEFIRINYEGDDGVYIAEGKIRYMERLGSETLAHVDVSNKSLVVIMPGLISSLRSKDTVRLSVAKNSVHIFDKNTGCRL